MKSAETGKLHQETFPDLRTIFETLRTEILHLNSLSHSGTLTEPKGLFGSPCPKPHSLLTHSMRPLEIRSQHLYPTYTLESSLRSVGLRIWTQQPTVIWVTTMRPTGTVKLCWVRNPYSRTEGKAPGQWNQQLSYTHKPTLRTAGNRSLGPETHSYTKTLSEIHEERRVCVHWPAVTQEPSVRSAETLRPKPVIHPH